MIIDNTDNKKLFFEEDEGYTGSLSIFSSTLTYYFPWHLNRSVLLTTYNKKLAIKFAEAKLTTIITIPEIRISESKNLLF